jgi:hypothetical protein
MPRLSLAIACAALATSAVALASAQSETSSTAFTSTARSLYYEETGSAYPTCPTCSLADLQYIFADTKDLLGLTKAA